MSVALTALVALAVSIPSDPFVRSRTTSLDDPNAKCLWWPNVALTYVQSSTGNPLIDNDAEFTAVTQSFTTWEAAGSQCSSLDFTEAARTSNRDIGFNPSSTSNDNLVLFRMRYCRDVVPASASCRQQNDCANQYDCWDYQDGTIALTTTTYDTNTGRVYDADIELNGATFYFTTVSTAKCLPGMRSQNCISTDVQNTMTHEIGHLLGLDHTALSSSTMNPNAGEGEIIKREVDPDTAGFLCEAYPKGRAPRECDSAGDPVPVPCSAYNPGSEPSGCERADDDDEGGGCAAAPGMALGAMCLFLAALPFARRRRT